MKSGERTQPPCACLFPLGGCPKEGTDEHGIVVCTFDSVCKFASAREYEVLAAEAKAKGGDRG